jgi:hypothetical protein
MSLAAWKHAALLKIVTGSTSTPASGAKYTGVFLPSGLNGLFS